MKTLHPDLFPETLLVNYEGEHVFTTSLKVAEHFNKQHRNVVRDIENLLTSLRPDSEDINLMSPEDIEFSLLNFEQSDYKNKRGKNYPMYKLTAKGFALVAMKFTGKEALRWQVKFLQAFEEMERQLLMQQKRESNALFLLRPKWGPITEHPNWPRKELIKQTGHKSPGSITACRRRMREVGLIN